MLKNKISKLLNQIPKDIPKRVTEKAKKKMSKGFKILPESLAGKASVVSTITFFFLISISGLASDYQSQAWSLSPMGGLFAHILLLVALSALMVGTLLGIYAVYKLKDYALMVAAAVLMGIVVLILR